MPSLQATASFSNLPSFCCALGTALPILSVNTLRDIVVFSPAAVLSMVLLWWQISREVREVRDLGSRCEDGVRTDEDIESNKEIVPGPSAGTYILAKEQQGLVLIVKALDNAHVYGHDA